MIPGAKDFEGRQVRTRDSLLVEYQCDLPTSSTHTRTLLNNTSYMELLMVLALSVPGFLKKRWRFVFSVISVMTSED